MTNRTISFLVKISILLIAFAGVIVCAFWYPFSTSFSLTEIGYATADSVSKAAAYWGQLLFYWIISLPCFAVLIVTWLLAENIKKDDVFSFNTSKKLTVIFYLLFVDSCIFIVGNTAFTILSWNLFSALYYFIGIFGMILSFVVYVIAKFVVKAQILKEENDSIV